MTVEFICGAECGLIDDYATPTGGNGRHWGAVSGGPFQVVTSPVRSGLRAYRCPPNTGSSAYLRTASVSGNAVYAGRVWVRIAAWPTATMFIIYAGVAAGNGFGIQVDAATHRFEIQAGGDATAQEHPFDLALDTWYSIQFLFNSSAGNNNAKMIVDGGTEVTATATQAATTLPTGLRVGRATANDATFDVYYDDITIGRATVDYDPSIIPRMGKIIGRWPNSSGPHSFTLGDFKQNNSTNIATGDTTVAHTLIDDGQAGGTSGLDSISDFISQNVIRTTGYIEFGFEAAAEGSDPKRVCIVSAHHASATQSNQCTLKWWNGVSEVPIYVDADFSNTTLTIDSHIDDNPSGGDWTETSLNALKMRWGYSGDVSGIPFLDGVVLEIEYEESTGLSVSPGLIQQLGTVFGPSVKQQLQPSLISQVAATFAPSVKNAIAPGLISNPGQVFAPSRIITDKINPALLQQLGIVFSPSVNQALPVGLITNLGQVFAPSRISQSNIGIGLISNLGVVHSPSLRQALVMGLIQQLGAVHSPSVNQLLAMGLIAQLGTVHSPTLAQSIALGLISQLGVTFDPTVSQAGGAQSITPGLISNAGQTFDPSIKQTVAIPIISNAGTVFTPQLNQAALMTLISNLGQVHAPAVRQQIQLGLISQLGQTFAPTRVHTDDILPALIQQLGVVFAPTRIHTDDIFPALIQNLGQVFGPSVQQRVTPGLISNLGVTFSPELELRLAVGLVSNLGQVFSPELDQKIVMGLVSNLGQVFAPDVIPTAAGQVNPQLILNLGQVFSPSLAQQVKAALIQQLGTTFAPTLVFNPRITPGLIAQLGSVFSPSIAQQLSLGLIPSGVQLFDPSVVTALEVPLISQAPLIFSPDILIAESVVYPPLISQLGQVFDPELVGELLLLPQLIENLGVVFAPAIRVGGQWLWLNGESGFGTTRRNDGFITQAGFGTTRRNEGDT